MSAGYFAVIDRQAEFLRTATTVDEVLTICPRPPLGIAHGWWGGDGDEMLGVLYAAGWRSHRYGATYLWVVREPSGDGLLSYVEGDLYRGDNVVIPS